METFILGLTLGLLAGGAVAYVIRAKLTAEIAAVQATVAKVKAA